MKIFRCNDVLKTYICKEQSMNKYVSKDEHIVKIWRTLAGYWPTFSRMLALLCYNSTNWMNFAEVGSYSWNPGRKTYNFANIFEFGAVQKCENLVDLRKCFNMNSKNASTWVLTCNHRLWYSPAGNEPSKEFNFLYLTPKILKYKSNI